MDKKYDVAVVGATGAVGETMLSILEERNFPVGEVYPLASERFAATPIFPWWCQRLIPAKSGNTPIAASSPTRIAPLFKCWWR